MNPQFQGVAHSLRLSLSTILLILVSLFVFSFSGTMMAQTTSGSIVGTIHDASGSVIPGARVTLTNVGTSENRAVQTDQNGSYQFVNLMPGRYQVAIEKEGFKKKLVSNLQVEVQQVVREDLALDIGDVTQTVQVTEQAALLQTEQSSLSQSVQGRTVQEMPLNGRNVMNLVSLAPGVVPQGNTSGSPVGGANGSTTNVNGWGNYQIGGGAANQSASYFDGAPLNVSYVNSTVLVPTQDAVQEFRVATNNVSPEFGRFSGGVINLASKSGTNSFHGSAYEYVRNTALNASNYFSTTKPGFHQNQFGASLSGPIFKDKTFFLGTWEKFRVRVDVPTLTNVPTSSMISGNFSALLGSSLGQTNPCDGTPLLNGQIFDPTTTRTVGGVLCRNSFPGNIIPSARLDSTSKIMAGQFGAPQGPNANALPGSNNWQGNGQGGGDTNQYNGRVDHKLNDTMNLFVRYTYWDGKTVPNDLFHNKATANQNIYTTQNASIGYTWMINPTTVADVRLSYLRFIFGFYPPSTGTNLASFGPAYATLAPQVLWQQPPASQVQGFQTFNYVTARNQNNNEALSESITKIMGRHNFKFGGESRLIEWGYGQTNYSSGQFTFNNAFTAFNPQSLTKYVPTGGNYSSGYSFASFMLGYAANPSQIQEILIAKQQMWYHGLYAADTYQVNSKLTLNLGVRWEYPGQFKEAHNSAAVFLPDATDPFGSTVGLPLKGLTTMVNSSSYSDRAIHPVKWNAFAPRVGFAYKATDETVIRGGYGISYLPNDVIFGNAPWTTPPSLATTPMNFSNDGGLTPADTVSNPFPGGILQPSRTLNNTQLEQRVLGAVIQLPVPNQKYPYSQQWNFAVQQQFAGNTALEIGYAGSKGTHLPANVFIRGFPYFELNQIADQYNICGTDKTQPQCNNHLLTDKVANPFAGKVPSTAGILTPTTIAYGQLLRPYPQFSSVNNTSGMYGSTIWHGLLTKIEKRFNGGGMILGTYTWSKLIGNSDTQTAWLDGSGGGNAAGIQDYHNLHAERSIASFDVPQRATISYVLDLPFGHGQRYAANASKLLDNVIGGWGVNGTTTFQSGFPIILIAQPSTLNSSFGAGITRPNYTAGCQKTPSGSAFSRVNQWFNTSCYTQPGGYSYGNAPRTDGGLRAQGVANWDAALNKNFNITEKAKLKFNAEFFNLFNRVQFAAPTAQVGNINNGKITATRNQQRLIQLALRLTF